MWASVIEQATEKKTNQQLSKEVRHG